MKKRNVDALTLKPGPTESGIPSPSPPPTVGGEVLEIDLLSAFLSNFWPLMVIALIPFGLLLYKKRHILPRFFLRAHAVWQHLTR